MCTAGMMGRTVAAIAVIGLVVSPTVAVAQNPGQGGAVDVCLFVD